ncbi:MAG: nicotinamide-nucleotide amidohydrolase family protein [Nitrospirota bacterium]|nr:nicotinamide-nucleotide amidohydrolase family protein [Nitrospirota bacterium]
MNAPRAELLLTGEELVTGKTADSNGLFLARKLAAMGLPCLRITLVGDGGAEITTAAREALLRADVVIVSGGLGPTGDDLTRPALALALNRPLTTPAPLPEHRPGALPEGGEQLHNPQGSAAGFWVVTETQRVLAALPGVPWELETMWPELERRLRAHFPHAVRHALTLRTVGRMERQLDQEVGRVLTGLSGVEWGVTANPLAVDLHLTAVDAGTLQDTARRLRTALGDVVYGEDDTPLAGVVGRLLRERGWMVATAESCTGGAICAALTAVAGASDYVERTVVSYSNAAKVEALGVPQHLVDTHGAVSEAVARAMAEGLLGRSHADITLAVTGIAGPGGGTPDKPVGLVFMAVATADGTFCRGFLHRGDRSRVIARSVTRGLDLLRRALLHGNTGLETHFPPTPPGQHISS